MTTSRLSLLRLGAVYSVANVLAAGAPFLLLPVLTRALTPAEYGEVVAFYMLVSICCAFAGLSLQSAVGVRWLDKQAGDPRRYTATALALAVTSTLLTAGAAALIGPHFFALPAWASALAAVSAGAVAIQSMRFAVWQSRSQPIPAATLQVSSAILNIGLSLLGVFVLGLGGDGRILGATLAGAVIAAVSIALFLRRQEATASVNTGDAKALLRFGAPLIPHVLAGAFLANADRIAVSKIGGAEALGIYGTAAQLGQVINVLADAMVKAFTPTIYKLLETNSMRDRLRIVGIAYLSAPIWLGVALALWLFFKLIGDHLLDARFHSAIDLSILFFVGGAISAVYLNVAGLFFFRGKTEWISLATIGSALVALLLASPAVHYFGVVGAAMTFIAAQLSLLILALVLSSRVSPMPWRRPRLAIQLLFRNKKVKS